MSSSEFQGVLAGGILPFQFRVRLLGWRGDFQRITATQVIRMHTHLSLAESVRCADDCLMGAKTILIPKSEQDARKLATELHRNGAVVTLE